MNEPFAPRDERPADPALAAAAAIGLARASRLIERMLPELSLADFRILSAIGEGEARAARLAERLALGKPTISATVDSLARRGLVLKRTSPDDQRVTELRLSEEGEHRLGEATAALAASVAALAGFSGDPAATLAALAGLGAAIDRRHAAVRAEGRRR